MREVPYHFLTADGRLGLTVSSAVMNRMVCLCQRSGSLETGGILVGEYNTQHSNAVVVDLSSPPEDSKRGRALFNRGVRGLQPWLNILWSKHKHYYLGEWHFHPFANPSASGIDMEQLRKNAKDPLLCCPEPVMMIIGGDPLDKWNVKAYVAPREKPVVEMIRSG